MSNVALRLISLIALVAVAILVVVEIFSPAAPVAIGLGTPATAEQLAMVDISIDPSGRGLPPGSGTVAQGAQIYTQKCESCHGVRGEGGPMDRLTGGIGTLTSERPVKTVASFWPYATTVFDYVRRAMPLNQPQSLRNEEVYALTAYLLSIDGIVPQEAVLDAQTLPAVQMPNRSGFVNWLNR